MGIADRAGVPGLRASSGAGLRLLVGWCSIAVALLNVLTELDRVPDRAYLLFHAVLQVNEYLQSISAETRTRALAGRELKSGVKLP